MSSEFALKLEQVSKSYPCYTTRRELFRHLLFPFRFRNRLFPALQPLSLEIAHGERVGIMGVNGSGKSTLLELIAGTVSPSGGTIHASGRIAPLLELGSWINASDTGRENIYTAGYLRGFDRRRIEEQLPGIIDFAEIGEFIDQPVSTYSTGMVMRLAFASCIYLEAEILLLDEIFAVGDARFAQKCISFLRDRVREKTVLLASHDVNVITMLCTRAILLDHGRLVADGSPRMVTERYLELCYGEKQPLNISEAKAPSMVEDFRPGGEIHILPFPSDAGRRFGAGGAELTAVEFTTATGAALSAVRGGEAVRLRIEARALRELEQPAAGFVVRTPDGQYLFGDTAPAGGIERLSAGARFETEFCFVLPRLSNGVYSIGAAISTGALESHHIQVWNHDALTFQVNSGYPLQGALLGLPMKSITCREIK